MTKLPKPVAQDSDTNQVIITVPEHTLPKFRITNMILLVGVSNPSETNDSRIWKGIKDPELGETGFHRYRPEQLSPKRCEPDI